MTCFPLYIPHSLQTVCPGSGLKHCGVLHTEKGLAIIPLLALREFLRLLDCLRFGTGIKYPLKSNYYLYNTKKIKKSQILLLKLICRQ